MKRVKRTLTLLLALAMLLSLAAPALASEYVVQKGDNLSKIALQQLGSSSKWRVIYNANKDKIKNPNLIYVGQKLTIPDGEPTPVVTPEPTPVVTPEPTAEPTPEVTPEPTLQPVVDTRPPETASYIPAPHVTNKDHLTDEILEPAFYENKNGPTIGVTLLGVIKQDGLYFRDLNNNCVLDTFEDWRLDARTRADAMAAALSVEQLTYNVPNAASYNPNKTKVADVVDENGKPVWEKIFSKGGGWGAPGFSNSIENLDVSRFRTFVIRNNPETEVAVWFNNGLEQYSELDAITKGEVAVPFFAFTNPIGHGLPNAEGVAAASLGDGNANAVLTDAQYDRQVMWAKGIDGIYGPQVDLVTDPRWSRNSTTYGEREDMAAEIAKNLTIGYQNGSKGMVKGSVLLTIKHFPGDGAAFNGFESHGQTGRYRVYTTENSLANYQLKPFIAAFEAGAAGIMPGYSQPIVDDRIAPQSITYKGKTTDIRYGGRGNAFNEDILLGLARDVLGFEGLINSDSLMVNAQQGVADLSSYERMVLFIKSGCDCGVISFNDANPAELLNQALANGDLTRADLERAASNRLIAQIQSGNLDNPYRDMEESVKTVNEVTPKVAELAEEFHLKSVVLMKNTDKSLPLTDTTKTVYICGFNAKDGSAANVSGIAKEFEALGFTVVDDYENADIAYLRVSPSLVGQASSELAILDLTEGVETPVYDNEAKRTEETSTVTTVSDMKTFKKIADAVHARGGKVIGEIKADNAWILTNMEPYCDALLGTFNTKDSAIAQVVVGKYNPSGKLPITMVADASVIALKETQVGSETWDMCVSPNDVPGYVKDQYMDPAVLAASPSGSYAYKDSNGNFYRSGFGLCYDTRLPATESYIPAPYLATNEGQLTSEILDPVFYENENGPTVGVTLLGVIKVDGLYFRDLNNNGKLDTYEDWRVDDETRAREMAKALSDHQLAYELLNIMMYSPKSAKTSAVVDENGDPVWSKLFSNKVSDLNANGMRNFVVRNNPETEVAVWFNNGLEQYSEYDAIQKGEVAVPFLSFTNPIKHGLPNSEGVTAAALGDGNADIVLTDAQYDRIVMWYKGIDALYGPQIDLVTDPRWSRNDGTYGEREDMSAEIAKNLTIGYQNGDQGMVPGSVLLTVKHFPGDGAAYNGFESHGYTGRYRVYSTENSLANYQLKPFIAAFEAGAAGVMPGYSQPIIDARIADQKIIGKDGKEYDIKLEGYGNAFNPDVLQYLLREVLGFEGLINSDSVSQSNAHGVENLSGYEQTVLFVNAGCDAGVFSAAGKMGGMTISPELIAEALANGDITRERLEDAAYHRILPRVQTGDLDNPYRDLEESVKAVNEVTPKVAELAEEIHLKSVVLMKNTENTLPLKDTGKKVYIHGFNQGDDAKVDGIVKQFEAKGFTVVDDYETADIAYLRVSPTIQRTGSSNLAILDLGESMETPIYDKNAKRTGETTDITTVSDMKTFKKIAEAVHARGGKVIGEINASNAWILTNMEPYCDALIGTFSTSDKAIAEVIVGNYNPTGKLPITMVADACVIDLVETDLGGEIWDVCVSPNDVPGYVKDEYMKQTENGQAALAKSPSGSYAYRDANGNLYVSGFGLSY